MDQSVWHVLGAGSIGCLWAASISAYGLNVELILRDERFSTLNHSSDFVTLRSQDKTERFPVTLTSPANINKPVSHLIICTKAQDALQALTSVANHLTGDARILLLQNGMGSQQAITRAFPTLNIWAGSVTDGAYLDNPLQVCHAGVGITCIGPLTLHAQPDDFDVLLSECRLNIKRTSFVEEKLWNKLAINSCINGLTALFNCRNGELLDGSERQQRLDQLIEETSAILQTQRIKSENLSHRVYNVCQKTATNVSSTCQDARSNRTTELAYINVFLIDIAREKGIDPLNHRRLIRDLTDRGIRY